MTGEFSGSWTEEYIEKMYGSVESWYKDCVRPYIRKEIKLLKFECINDEEFTFNKHFKLK